LEFLRRFTTSKPPGKKTGRKKINCWRRLKPRRRKDSKSGPTCILTPRPARDSMPACRRGPKMAVTRRCLSACAIRRRARKSRPKFGWAQTPGRICIWTGERRAELRVDSDASENLYLAAGSPERILLAGFKSKKLKPFTGKSLAEVAKMRGKDPVETIMDLISEDESRIGAIYYLMSEGNVKKELAKPWISFGSDEASQAPEGVFLKSNPHPRAYGNFARVLGKYARDEKVITLPEAVRRLSALPATNLGLDHRGFIQDGMFADVVVFDPATIADRATFDKPHQYAVGMKHVFVNGVQVLKDGEHTGAKPGRALAGPGKAK